MIFLIAAFADQATKEEEQEISEEKMMRWLVSTTASSRCESRVMNRTASTKSINEKILHPEME
jgi:hypothetical protein